MRTALCISSKFIDNFVCDIDNMWANFHQDRTIEHFQIFDIENFCVLHSQFLCCMITSEKNLLFDQMNIYYPLFLTPRIIYDSGQCYILFIKIIFFFLGTERHAYANSMVIGYFLHANKLTKSSLICTSFERIIFTSLRRKTTLARESSTICTSCATYYIQIMCVKNLILGIY